MLLGKLIVGLTVFFLLLSLTARALGNTQPPNPALRGFVEGCEDKPQPCWYGIVPGVTTAEEGNMVLNSIRYEFDETVSSEFFRHYSQPNSNSCRVILENDHVTSQIRRLTVANCKSLIFGNILAIFSDIDGITNEESTGISLQNGQISANFFPSDNNSLGWISSIKWPISFSLNTPVIDPKSLIRWHGFIRSWRFCQLEPDICQSN
jgi:hypothetical protein